jgi:hypothetical protein
MLAVWVTECSMLFAFIAEALLSRLPKYAYADLTTVTVTLRSLIGDFDQRQFILTPDSPVITIGRASKSIAKNILGAVDNAWFDSPVMSRSHAKLKFDDQEAVSSSCSSSIYHLC